MREQILTKRYADAFVDHARETLSLEQIVVEIKNLKRIISDNPDFFAFLLHPEILLAEKYEFIEILLKKNFSEEIRQFLKLLVEKRRTGLILRIADYIRVHYSPTEAIDVLLKTSYAIDLDIIAAIKEKLKEKLKKNIDLYLELDANLLGGVQVVIGNTVIDGSVRRRLDDLREKLNTLKVF